MATRSNIAYETKTGNITSTYCHWDGYPGYNGRMLLQHYAKARQALTLSRKGYISTIEATLDACDIPAKGIYGSGPRRWADREDAIRNSEEYLYLWVAREGCWYYSDHQGPLKPLTLKECESTTPR